MNEYCPIAGITLTQRMRALWKEVFRKSIHLCTAFVPLLLHFNKIVTIILLACALVFYAVCELLRLKGKTIPFVSAITAAAARKRDENRFVLGPVTLVIGILIAAILWDEKAARIGIFALAFGDGLASLGGKILGRVTVPFTGGKTAAGSLTCFSAIFISSFCVCFDVKHALLIASAGMVIEILPLKDYDNVLIPFLLGGLAQFFSI